MPANDRCFPFLNKMYVTSLFGPRTPVATTFGTSSTDHMGIDLVGKGSIIVVASAPGTVKRVQYQKGYGNYVWVANDDGTGAVYAHLKSGSILVKVGQHLTCKQHIGTMGSSGNVSGAHLHFGISTSPDYSTTHTNKKKYFFNPAVYWGMQNIASIYHKTFDCSGMISGYASDINSTNNNYNSVDSSSVTTTKSSYSSSNSLLASGEYYKVTNFAGTLGDWLYGRKYRIIVDLGNNKSFDVSELKCVFEINKDCQTPYQYSTITIYNLSPEDENKIIKEGQRVIVEAGYIGSQYGIIFAGNIIQPIRGKENGVDYKLTLVAMDNDKFVTAGLVNISINAQQNSRAVVNAIITKSSQQTGQGYLVDTTIKYPRGKVMFGMSRDYLEQIARSENSRYYMEDGKVNIVSAEGFKKGNILAFGPKTGLINSPQQTSQGVSCDVLLNPNVSLNTLFYLDNRKVQGFQYTPGQPVRSLDTNGIYRAITVTHTGDTRGDTWNTHIEAITQAGLLPNMNANSAVYNW